MLGVVVGGVGFSCPVEAWGNEGGAGLLCSVRRPAEVPVPRRGLGVGVGVVGDFVMNTCVDADEGVAVDVDVALVVIVVVVVEGVGDSDSDRNVDVYAVAGFDRDLGFGVVM